MKPYRALNRYFSINITRNYSSDLEKPNPYDMHLKLKESDKFNQESGLRWLEPYEVVKKKREHFIPRDKSHIHLILKFRKILDVQEWILWFKNSRARREIYHQRYLPQRMERLKPDLAAANFIVYRTGAVQFLGEKEWIKLQGNHSYGLPNYYVVGLFIGAIDCRGTRLMYDGLLNMRGLKYLKHLNISGLDRMNDWCMDFISSEYRESLEYLDISNCKNITAKGLSCAYRFEKLRILNVTGMTHDMEFRLACLMLKDVIPDLKLIGFVIPDDAEYVLPAIDFDEPLEKVPEITNGKK